ncbi:MAG TPA: hypothetical protein PLH94_04555 [Fimbriimonadaceae bacterium]|nr:hypothetical protein [Fimbriimonadaceae bacterium]
MIAALVAVALIASFQEPVQPAAAPSRLWMVNPNNTLVWDGKPYLPVGLRIEGTPEAIQQARSAGVNDVIVELPADGSGWAAALRSLEDAGMRYLIAINSAAPACTGVAVEPEGYRIPNITGPTKIDMKIPGATSALTVIATQRDGAVQDHRRIAVTDGRIETEIDPRMTLEHVFLVYPVVTELRVPDFWSAFDVYRDRLLATLRTHKPGRGLRGILNPMGVLIQFPNADSQFVPNDPAFRSEFEAFLRSKYASVDTALRSWTMAASEIGSFAEMARLVPLWSSTRGVTQFWDPEKDFLFACEGRKSAAWRDIQGAIRQAASRRFERLVASIQQISDVPVLQDWNGWTGPYSQPSPGVNGIGMPMRGPNPTALIDSAAPAASQILRWKNPGWLFASQIEVTGENPAPQIRNTLDDAASLGARGWFVIARDAATRKAVADAADLSQDATLGTWKPIPLFFPETTTNPPAAQRLPGGKWWLPAPVNGNRIDLGSGYAAYRLIDGAEPFVAFWRTGQPAKVKVRLANPKQGTFAAIDGSDLKMKPAKDGIEMTIGNVPILFTGSEEVPVPEDALLDTMREFDEIFARNDRRIDAPEESFLYKDSLAGFDRNPGGSLLTVRAQLQRLYIRLARYSWIEAENTRETTFSEITPEPGVSNGAVLTLRSRLGAPPEGYVARYEITSRTEAPHEVWIAGRIPVAQRAEVSARIGDQVVRIQQGPLSLYSNGLGWYRLGSFNLVPGKHQLEIVVDAKEGAFLAIDTIVVTSRTFQPNGVFPPKAYQEVGP